DGSAVKTTAEEEGGSGDRAHRYWRDVVSHKARSADAERVFESPFGYFGAALDIFTKSAAHAGLSRYPARHILVDLSTTSVIRSAEGAGAAWKINGMNGT